MQPLLPEILTLPGIEVDNYTDLGSQFILEVEAVTTQATCPRCQKISCHWQQNHWSLARDLSISGRTVFLKVNRRQFQCPACGQPFSETLDFIGNCRKQTDRFAE